MDKPLPKTYRIERQLIHEHNQRMLRARQDYGRVPICPDCFRPPEKHGDNFDCTTRRGT